MYSYKKKSFWNENGEFVLKILLRLGISALVSIVVSAVIYFFFINVFTIPSSAMLPKYPIGKRLLINCWSPSANLSYEDIVISKYLETELVIIGKIVGKPKDKIKIVNKKVYRNNQIINEAGIQFTDKRSPLSLSFSKRDNLNEIELQENEYFILCNNRDECVDSREIGKINANKILGKVIF
ncbi:MAG: signal peptidase I [Leptospiraceae bacterium]|nr:signal peptidase I [Leptospiraceae bacterium]